MSRDILRSSSRLSLDLSDKAPRVLGQQSKTKSAATSSSVKCKIVVVGDSECGKSSLISSFLGHNDGEFSEVGFENVKKFHIIYVVEISIFISCAHVIGLH